MNEAEMQALLRTGFPFLGTIFSFLKIPDRMRLERVHATWRMVAMITYLEQKAFRLSDFEAILKQFFRCRESSKKRYDRSVKRYDHFEIFFQNLFKYKKFARITHLFLDYSIDDTWPNGAKYVNIATADIITKSCKKLQQIRMRNLPYLFEK